MLPEISLDDEDYEEIFNEARNMAASIYPAWTDFNAHDPGVTMLELFAVMKESQQFYMDQIGTESREGYLKLLGVARRGKEAAHSLAWFEADRDLTLLCGHKLDAGGICFETLCGKQLTGGDVAFCLSLHHGREQDYAGECRPGSGRGMHFFPFGKEAKRGSRCYFCFLQGLQPGVVLDMYLEVFKGYPVPRNQLDGNGFVPPAVLRWQYYTAQGWEDIGGIQDGTYGFLFDGFVRFVLKEPMRQTQAAGHRGYFIRVLLEEEDYEIPPVVAGISMNICEVVQKDTVVEAFWRERGERMELDTEMAVTGTSEIYLERDGIFYPAAAFGKSICEEQGKARFEIHDESLGAADAVLIVNRDLSYIHRKVVGTGNGFPCQEIALEDTGVMEESLALLIEDTCGGGGFRLWQRVRDFAGSAPEDRHYIFDSQRGAICFGNGIHGMPPEGKILLAGFARTLGSGGNIKEGRITCFRMEGLGEIPVTNICAGTGGRDGETLEECFLRARKRLERPECAVSAGDYERYVQRTPGLMIEGCKVLPADDVRQFREDADETAVYIVVKPYGWSGDKSDSALPRRGNRFYCRNIRGYLERYRMVGSNVFLLFPEQVEMEVYIEAVVEPEYLHIRERVQQAVGRFFRESQHGVGDAVIYSKLYGYLDRLTFIRDIRSLNIETVGSKARRNAEGDVLLPPNGTAVLRKVDTSLTMG